MWFTCQIRKVILIVLTIPILSGCESNKEQSIPDQVPTIQKSQEDTDKSDDLRVQISKLETCELDYRECSIYTDRLEQELLYLKKEKQILKDENQSLRRINQLFQEENQSLKKVNQLLRKKNRQCEDNLTECRSTADTMPKNPIFQRPCIDAFLKAERIYKEINENYPLDISNFTSAVEPYKRARTLCTGHEYEDDIIFALANSYFYNGNSREAAAMYREIHTHYPYGKYDKDNFSLKEARALENCLYDSASLEFFRKGSLYALHLDVRRAIDQYRKASESRCDYLRDRSEALVKELRE